MLDDLSVLPFLSVRACEVPSPGQCAPQWVMRSPSVWWPSTRLGNGLWIALLIVSAIAGGTAGGQARGFIPFEAVTTMLVNYLVAVAIRFFVVVLPARRRG